MALSLPHFQGGKFVCMILCAHHSNGGEQREKSGDWTGVAGSGHEERGEGGKQQKMTFFKRLFGKEKRDSGEAAATEDGTLRR